MPREKINIPCEIDHLSILSEDGEADEELVPDLAEDELLRMHRSMLLTRRFDERMLSLQRQGQIGTFAPVSGQEASQIGAISALDQEDWLVPAFRETAAMLWRGTPMAGILIFNGGYNEGGRIPDDQNDFPIAVPVASQLPHAAGIGYAMKYLDDDRVVMTFFGDGATSEGDFHESLNFAGVFGVPVVFVCQNNQWAISTPRERQSKSKTLAQKAVAYGIPGIQVDGNDVFAVRVAANEAVERAREGDGPTLIECVTYRLSVHTTADDPSKYRSEEEVEEWEARDPITRFQSYLIDRDLLTEDDIESLESEIKDEIDDAWDEAKATMSDLGDPDDMFDHVYAELPPYVQQQRENREASDGEDD